MFMCCVFKVVCIPCRLGVVSRGVIHSLADFYIYNNLISLPGELCLIFPIIISA